MVNVSPSAFDAPGQPAANEVDGPANSLPTPLGRRAFIAGAAGAAGALALSQTADAAVPSGATYFVPLPPRRLCDTRPSRAGFRGNYGFTRLNATTIRVRVAGNGDIPASATAAVLTVAGIGTTPEANWVQVVPAGTNTTVSNVNMNPTDSVVANLVTVKLSANGSVDIRSLFPNNIICDIAGAYVPTATKRRSGRLKTIDPVVRPYDTRSYSNNRKIVGDGEVVNVDLNAVVPGHATAVVANITAVRTQKRGFLTLFPGDETTIPTASSLNFGPAENRAVAVVAKLGKKNGRQSINIFNRGGSHLLVDVAGYITGEGAEESDEGLFVPISPNRMLDSRRPADKVAAGNKSRLWPGWTRAFVPSVPAQAGAISMNLTAIKGMQFGFLTVLPARTVRQQTSNLNVSYPGQTIANHTITRMTNAGVEVFADSGCHLACDVNGWFVGPKSVITSGVPNDPPPPAAALPWKLDVPRLAKRNGQPLSNAVYEGSPDPIVDGGHSWHWSGTGKVGQSAAIVAFGHRTSKGGPYYGQHRLSAGDLLFVTTGDQRVYTYRWVREELTSKFSRDILAASRRVGGQTFTLVACTGSNTVANDQPLGKVEFRIVSTFELVNWADVG